MKKIFSFEFWQKFGKALMVVVAVMPAAGLMISIGKSIHLINPDWTPLVTTGGVTERRKLGKRKSRRSICSWDLIYFNQSDHWGYLWCHK